MVKPEHQVEKYAFLRLYDQDFEMALHTIKVLKRYRKSDVRFPLLRDIVVSYCRPFTESRGIGIKKDFLDNRFPDEEMEELHEELLKLRKQLFAHTDLSYKQPKISNWSTEQKKWFPVSFKGFDYQALDSKLPKIQRLIQCTQSNLREKIAEYENHF